MTDHDAIPEPFSEAEFAEARRYSLVIAWSDEDACYLVTAPELPGLVTHGSTIADAAEMGEEAIAAWLDGRRRFGHPVPAPGRSPRRLVLERPGGYDADAVRAVRQALSLTPQLFAELLAVSPELVAAWERGELAPDARSARLLEIADRHPEVLFRELPVPA